MSKLSDEVIDSIAGASWDAIIDGAEPWAGQDEETIRIHTETTRAVLEAAAPHMLRDASADVAAAFANAESAKRALVARAVGVDPEVARSLGYGTTK